MNVKPTVQQHFVQDYFEPTRRQMPTAPLPAVLDKAKEVCPFEVRIEIATLHRLRSKKR